jgi:hypothetical protein
MKLRKMYGERCSFDGVYPKAIKLGKRAKDLTGKRFGRLVVLKPIARGKNRKLYWYCKCDCGVLKKVRGDSLVTEDIKSCGCLNKELSNARFIAAVTKGPNKTFIVGDTTYLVLSDKNGCWNGLVILDTEDLELVKGYRWCRSHGYVVHGQSSKRFSRLVMHESLNNKDCLFVDHINHNTLDNRKQNLRVCTPQQNVHNMRLPKHNTSGNKGVYEMANGRIRAIIWHNNKPKHLGYFDTKEEAAKAYNEAALKYFGEFACLNT